MVIWANWWGRISMKRTSWAALAGQQHSPFVHFPQNLILSSLHFTLLAHFDQMLVRPTMPNTQMYGHLVSVCHLQSFIEDSWQQGFFWFHAARQHSLSAFQKQAGWENWLVSRCSAAAVLSSNDASVQSVAFHVAPATPWRGNQKLSNYLPIPPLLHCSL